MRMSAGSYWVRVLDLIRLGPPFCDTNTCPWGGAIYFVAFPVCIGFVFTSILSSIVLDFVTVERLHRRLNTSLLTTYTRLWAYLDRDATGAIPAHKFNMLWRIVQAYSSQREVLHAGLGEWRLNPINAGQVRKWPTFVDSLKFPIVLWPVTRMKQVCGLGWWSATRKQMNRWTDRWMEAPMDGPSHKHINKKQTD